MEQVTADFLNIKYVGRRFSGGRLPLEVLADLQALQDILTTFAREIWLKENNRERMPNGYADWFRMSLKGVAEGSALPKLELSVLMDGQPSLLSETGRNELMRQAQHEFAGVLRAASDGQDVVLSPSQIRNFNRFLTNLKPGELFQYSPSSEPINSTDQRVISLDIERRKRFLTSVTPIYDQRIQGRARLKSVDESGMLRFVSSEFREFSITDPSQEPTKYGMNIGSYYEFDLTVVRRHDDSISSIITIHDLSLLEDPSITAIDEMAGLEDGWLDGHGKAVSVDVRNTAKSFLSHVHRLPQFYAVAATEHGGILLEYECNGWDYGIEFNADGSYRLFSIEVSGDGETSETYAADEFKKFIADAKETIGPQ